MYVNDACTDFSCSRLDDMASCAAGEGCVWKAFGANGYCSEFSCYDAETKAECESHKDCSWSGDSCRSLMCSDMKSQSDCDGTEMGCEWTGFGCSMFSCYDKETEALCIASGKCKWQGSYCIADYDLTDG
jgi:hypothetical protein